MAEDLGSIRYRNPNAGTRVVDRSAEVRAISEGLETAKVVIDEGIKASVTEDMLDVIEQSAEQMTMAQEAAPETTVYPKGSVEHGLQTQVDRLTAQMDQGNVSRRTDAEMRIKTILNEAQVKYPWLYDDLQRRAGQVVVGSATLQEVGLEDAYRAEAAKTASATLDELVAYGEELGVPSWMQVGTSEWYETYGSLARTDMERQIIEDFMQQHVNSVNTGITNPALHREIMTGMWGQGGVLQTAMAKQFNDFGWAQVQREIASPSGDLQFIENWKAVDGPGMIIALQGSIQQWKSQTVPALRFRYRGTFYEKDFEAMVEDANAYADSLIATAKDFLNDVPDAEHKLNTALKMRVYSQFNDASSQSQTVFAMLGTLFTQDMALTAWREMFPGLKAEPTEDPAAAVTLLAPHNPTTYEDITSNSSVGDISRAWANRAKVNDIPFGTRNPLEDQQAILNTAELIEGIYKRTVAMPDNANPELAEETLFSFGSALTTIKDSPLLPSNVVPRYLEMFASGNLDHAVDASLAGGASTYRNAFGEAVKDYYGRTNPQIVRDTARNGYHAALLWGSATLNDLTTVDPEAAADGEFKWNYNDTQVKALVEAAPNPGGGVETQMTENRAKKEIAKRMAELEKQMQQQIKTEMLINKAESVDGTNFIRSNEWSEFFFNGTDDPNDSWYDVFFPGGPLKGSRRL
jgi:hypothetical protein